MTKNIIIGFLGFVVIAGGIFFFNSNPIKKQNPKQQKNQQTQEKTPTKSNENKKVGTQENTNTGNTNVGNGIKIEDNNGIVGGGIKFNDNKKDQGQNLNLPNFNLQIDADKMSMNNNIDVSKTITLENGEIWTKQSGDCDLTKMRIISQNSDYKEVELTTKSGKKIKTIFAKTDKGSLWAKNNINYTANTHNGIQNITSFVLGHDWRKGKDGHYHIVSSIIALYGQNQDDLLCVDKFKK